MVAGEKKILHLTLMRKWFDAIASGQKTKEYRLIKPYWVVRLENNSFDEVHFKNGYSRSAPFMRVECLGISKTREKYVIHLGKILEVKNY